MSSRFWYLDPPRRQGLAEVALDTDYERIICPAHDGHTRGGKRIGALSVIVHPLRVGDFTFVWGGGILVSQRVLDLFEKYHVTGFKAERAKTSYPETIKGRPPDLFELVVTGCRPHRPQLQVRLHAGRRQVLIARSAEGGLALSAFTRVFRRAMASSAVCPSGGLRLCLTRPTGCCLEFGQSEHRNTIGSVAIPPPPCGRGNILIRGGIHEPVGLALPWPRGDDRSAFRGRN